MDYPMPLTEAISLSTLTSTTMSVETNEATTIATMTSDDESDQQPVAPSLLHHDHDHDPSSSSTTPPINDDPLFTIPSSYLQHPRQCGSVVVYDITAQQYHDLQVSYASHPMTSDTQLFPWLHGVDGLNYHQCLFFGVRRMVVPKHRGLLLLHTNSGGGDTSTTTTPKLAQSFDPDDILDAQTGGFIKAAPPSSSNNNNITPSIHLRNFGIQPWRYASISDIVIYGAHSDQLAQRVALAQQQIYNERQVYHQRLQANGGKRAVRHANDLTYRIFIITDPMDVFQSQFSHLISQDNTMHGPSFLDLEKQAMRTMTKATELTENLWVGNTGDAPTEDLDSDSDDDDDDNDAMGDYSVCIECHDLADMPTTSILMLAYETLNESDGDSVIHLDMISTCDGDEEQQPTLTNDLIKLLQFMDEIITMGRKILIHCSDGYTETSILALAWLMYKYRLTLPDAYLTLQSKRSFFVMSTDLTFLQHLESSLLGTTTTTTTTPTLLRRKSTTTTTTQSRTLYDDQYLSSRRATETAVIDETIQLPMDDDDNTHWFSSPRFEGSFPSRILDFLYLGNLNHATNPGMLHALGITHVVSVGENTNLDASQFQLLYLDNLYDDGIDSIKGRYQETMTFIDDARNQQTKCLVHCRVGVSRSAALTICYVMQHCQLSLVDAYIFVRAHRLNVIIQPNLKFMYELLQLEQQLYGRMGLSWPVLCQHIHGLNQAYEDEEDDNDQEQCSTMMALE